MFNLGSCRPNASLQVMNFLTQVEEGAEVPLDDMPIADPKSEVSTDVQCSGCEDVHQYAPACPNEAAATSHEFIYGIVCC